MWLFLLLPLLAQLFSNVVGDSANEFYIKEFDSSTEIQGLWNFEPPFGVHLAGVYKKSFAYGTIKDRLPSILTKLIDSINHNNEEIAQKYGNDSLKELQQLTDSFNKLKSEIMTNQHLTPLPLAHNEADRDAAMWNDYLELRRELEGPNLSWFFTRFLLSECYAYRRINQALALTKNLKNFDPFEKQKQESFTNSIESVTFLAMHMIPRLNTSRVSTDELKHELATLLKLSLWGNKFDLSVSSVKEVDFIGDPVELINSFEKDLLIDDTGVVWDILSNRNKKNVIVDIVFDNAGYELFADLCLASFLIVHRIADKVRFHVKQIPWFVSDVTIHDFNWVIEYMRYSMDPDLRIFGELCTIQLKYDAWSIEVEPFWTTYNDYGQMKKQAPALYKKLSEATLVIFKGDLNYRKLVGEINWEHSTTLDTVLFHQDFRPTNVVSLRTLKTHICVGLTLDKVRLWKKDKKLMDHGEYGVIDAAVDAPCVCDDKQ